MSFFCYTAILISTLFTTVPITFVHLYFQPCSVPHSVPSSLKQVRRSFGGAPVNPSNPNRPFSPPSLTPGASRRSLRFQRLSFEEDEEADKPKRLGELFKRNQSNLFSMSIRAKAFLGGLPDEITKMRPSGDSIDLAREMKRKGKESLWMSRLLNVIHSLSHIFLHNPASSHTPSFPHHFYHKTHTHLIL